MTHGLRPLDESPTTRKVAKGKHALDTFAIGSAHGTGPLYQPRRSAPEDEAVYWASKRPRRRSWGSSTPRPLKPAQLERQAGRSGCLGGGFGGLRLGRRRLEERPSPESQYPTLTNTSPKALKALAPPKPSSELSMASFLSSNPAPPLRFFRDSQEVQGFEKLRA